MPGSTISLSAIIIILFSQLYIHIILLSSTIGFGIGSTIGFGTKKGFGFLYLCIGEGCTSGEIALTLLSIVGSIGLCCLCAYLKKPVNLKNCLSCNVDEITNNTNQRTNANEWNNGDELV